MSFEFFSPGQDVPVELPTDKQHFLDLGRVDSVRVDRLELSSLFDCGQQLSRLNT